MGCARKLTFSWGGNPGVGSLHRLRDAVEHGWPRPLELDEHSHAGMAAAYLRRRGAAAVRRAARLPRHRPDDGQSAHPPRRLPVHRRDAGRRAGDQSRRHDPARAARRPRRATSRIHGIVGAQREAALAATTLVVTVEEIVDALPPAMNAHRAAALGRQRGRALPGRRLPVLRAGLLRARQRLLPALGCDRARPRELHWRGCSGTCSARADHAAFLASLRQAGGMTGWHPRRDG